MYELLLSEEAKTALETRHRSTRNVHERDRLKALLLRSEGWSVSSIAQALRAHESTITRQVRDYVQSEKTHFCKGGRSSMLSVEQTERLIAHLEKTLYHHTRDIVTYIADTFKVRYSVAGLNKWLHRQGFSYKHPKGRPLKADTEKQAKFIESYGALKAGLGPDEHVLFIDAVHPTQATKRSYGWIRTGKTYEVSTTASRSRINLMGAIELGDLANATVLDYDTINADNIGQFFDAVREKYATAGKLHIILDQAGYHRSEDLKKKAASLNMDLHYLPPYSPNLNPIERLWKVMNEHVRNNVCFASTKEFKDKIKGFFEYTLPNIGQHLGPRINDNFQRLKPAL